MKAEMLSGIMEDVEIAPTATVTRNRFGYTINGERLKRVTTLLKGIPKPALVPWAAKSVAEFAVDHRDKWSDLPRTDAIKLLKGSPYSKRDDAGDRGSAIHKAIECYSQKVALPMGMTEDQRSCADAAIAFLRARGSRALATELTVFNLTVGYAGTLDLWELHEGISWILDYKTSSGIYPDHAVQQIAYMNAEYAVVQSQQTGDEAWTGKLIPWRGIIERCGVVHVQPDGATLYPIREDYHAKLWDVFRAATFIKNWQADTDSYKGKTPRERVYDDTITHGDEDVTN